MRTIFVDCKKDGKIFRTYDHNIEDNLAGHLKAAGWTAVIAAHRKSLIDDAQASLANEGLAGPPYSGIEFVVR